MKKVVKVYLSLALMSSAITLSLRAEQAQSVESKGITADFVANIKKEYFITGGLTYALFLALLYKFKGNQAALIGLIAPIGVALMAFAPENEMSS